MKPTEVNNRWMWATDGGGVADAFAYKSEYNIFILIYSAIKACKICLIPVQGQFPFLLITMSILYLFASILKSAIISRHFS